MLAFALFMNTHERIVLASILDTNKICFGLSLAFDIFQNRSVFQNGKLLK